MTSDSILKTKTYLQESLEAISFNFRDHCLKTTKLEEHVMNVVLYSTILMIKSPSHSIRNHHGLRIFFLLKKKTLV